jgi:aminoglycoside phosphotransferase family enzyme/predicted kinase
MTDQTEVMAFLADPATHGGQAVERIDTHISAVFLVGDLAFKIKKAVTLPFLDFSRLEARKHAVEAELAVNRRATPDLYLGADAITREADGRLAFNGAGLVVDWLVRMKRFDQAGLFDRLIGTGQLDRQRANQLTEAIFAFHQSAPVRTDRGGAAGLVWTIDTNRASMEPYPGCLEPAKVAALAEHSHAELARLTPLLEERRAKGLVRWCHGDLHLGNICLLDGRPALFDAIEFSEDIACVDVFYDLAFLLMDLDHRGAKGVAGWVMNHYLDLSGDFAAMAALPLFLSLRAGVRAHVSATMAEHAGAERRAQLESEAGRYLDEALAYLTPPAPRLLAVGGLSGSGKSRMGRELAPLLGVPAAAVVRTDSLRKHLAGVAITEKLGPEGYSKEMGERTYQALYDTCAQLLAAGHSAVADAVFAKPHQRAAIEAVAARAGVRFDGLWLETPPDLAISRIEARKANVSDATPEVLKRQLAYDLGAITWTRIDSSDSKESTLARGQNAVGLAPKSGA